MTKEVSKSAGELHAAITFIVTKASESDLEAVFNAYKQRHKELRAQVRAIQGATLKVGDKVRFVNTVTPVKYRGATGTITERTRNGKFLVLTDAVVTGRTYPISVPADLLEKMQEAML